VFARWAQPRPILILRIDVSWKISEIPTRRHTSFFIRACKSFWAFGVIIGVKMATLLVAVATLPAHCVENKQSECIVHTC